MDFTDAEYTSFADEVERFVRENVGEERLREIRLRGDAHDVDVHRLLTAQGWMAGPWPVEFDGGGWDRFRTMAFRVGLRRAGYHGFALATTVFVGEVIQRIGTDFQRQAVLPALASGEAVICLGYTEPDSGSDVMAARTRAVREGDAWVIDGTKMFTTAAHVARWCFLLTRTDPEAPKHSGLTMFLVPLDTPGISITPVRTMSDERSNAVFYDGVRVDDRWRVGEVDGGVRVLSLALEMEQGATFVPELEDLYDAAVAWSATTDASGRAHRDDPVVREAITELALDIELSWLLLQQSVWRRERGLADEGRGPMSKLYSSERLVHHSGRFLDLIGAAGVLAEDAGGAAESAGGWLGEAERLYRFAPGTVTYGGTSEILRSRIAEAGLGLPRSRR